MSSTDVAIVLDIVVLVAADATAAAAAAAKNRAVVAVTHCLYVLVWMLKNN